MKREIFEYRDYKAYLRDLVDLSPNKGRGFKASLARASRCHTAYISQVFNGKAHFSLEQADALSRFIGHTREETGYFLLLLQYARAGTPTLKKYFSEEIQKALEKRLVLKDRLDVKKSLSRDDQSVYYSSWQYAAIHVMLSIPEFQSKEAIARYLDLPLARVTEILDFLVSVGLASKMASRFEIGTTRIHLGTDSPWLPKHHINWRFQAARSLERNLEDDLHYSSVVTCSREDALKIKAMIVKNIESVKGVVKDSKEEQVCSFLVDFFRV